MQIIITSSSVENVTRRADSLMFLTSNRSDSVSGGATSFKNVMDGDRVAPNQYFTVFQRCYLKLYHHPCYFHGHFIKTKLILDNIKTSEIRNDNIILGNINYYCNTKWNKFFKLFWFIAIFKIIYVLFILIKRIIICVQFCETI